MGRIKGQKIMPCPQPAISQQVSRIALRKQRLSGGDWRSVALCHPPVRLEIERVADIFEPAKPEVLELIRSVQRILRRIEVHRVNGDGRAVFDYVKDGLDTLKVDRE